MLKISRKIEINGTLFRTYEFDGKKISRGLKLASDRDSYFFLLCILYMYDKINDLRLLNTVLKAISNKTFVPKLNNLSQLKALCEERILNLE